jgi:hypothetical protein
MREAFLGGLAVTCLACSPANVVGPSDSGHDAPDVTARDAAAIETVCRNYGHDYCFDLTTCSQAAYTSRFGSDTTTCPMLVSQLCENILDAPSTSASLTSYGDCTKQIASWDCADLLDLQNPPPDCRPTGPRSTGASCAVPEQCQSGFCGYPPGSNCGKCVPVPTSCEATQCPTGASCVAAQCVFPQERGQPCSPTLTCKPGLACVTPAMATGMGPSCQEAPSEAGAPCSLTGDILPTCDFFAGLSCDGTTGKCVIVPFADIGQACGIVAGIGTVCSAGTCIRGLCVANVLVGGACELGEDPPCVSGTGCIVTIDGGTKGTCQVRGSSACD